MALQRSSSSLCQTPSSFVFARNSYSSLSFLSLFLSLPQTTLLHTYSTMAIQEHINRQKPTLVGQQRQEIAPLKVTSPVNTQHNKPGPEPKPELQGDHPLRTASPRTSALDASPVLPSPSPTKQPTAVGQQKQEKPPLRVTFPVNAQHNKPGPEPKQARLTGLQEHLRRVRGCGVSVDEAETQRVAPKKRLPTGLQKRLMDKGHTLESLQQKRIVSSPQKYKNSPTRQLGMTPPLDGDSLIRMDNKQSTKMCNRSNSSGSSSSSSSCSNPRKLLRFLSR